MDSPDATVVDSLNSLRTEVAELKDLMRELLIAVGKVDESTKDSATKITSAIQRWT